MHIYFLGICGAGMGNAALLMRSLGHVVRGSDQATYPPMSDILRNAAIEVFQGFDAERLARLAPDLVVIGNATSRGNPEVEFLLATRRFPFTSFPALLEDLVLRKRRTVVVAGTHGKTTTTAITAFLLEANGARPGFFIGGAPTTPPVAARLGKGAPFVIEGDEYDTAFFDKRSKFVHYAPHTVVLNNLEFDHADIFRDLQDVRRSFSHLLRLIPANGCLLANGDDENIRSLLPVPWTTTLRVGLSEENDLRICSFREETDGSSFELWWRDTRWGSVRWGLPGLFNARNAAMAALATARELRPEADPTSLELAALSGFQGVKRRQQVLLNDTRLVVIEDFAHHPTAVAGALEAFRERYPGRVLHAAFEPRSNTSRTRAMQEPLTRALQGADRVWIGAVHRAGQLPGHERFDTAAAAADLRGAGVDARAFSTNELLLDGLLAHRFAETDPPGVLVFFSNGSFDGILPRFLESLARS